MPIWIIDAILAGKVKTYYNANTTVPATKVYVIRIHAGVEHRQANSSAVKGCGRRVPKWRSRCLRGRCLRARCLRANEVCASRGRDVPKRSRLSV